MKKIVKMFRHKTFSSVNLTPSKTQEELRSISRKFKTSMENNKSEPPERKISGKLARIVTDFFDFSKFCFLLSGVAEMVEDAVPETSAEVQQYLFEDMLVCRCEISCFLICKKKIADSHQVNWLGF